MKLKPLNYSMDIVGTKSATPGCFLRSLLVSLTVKNSLNSLIFAYLSS